MVIFTERDAENFLKKKGFNIIKTIFIKRDSELDKLNFKGNFIMKVSSKKIVHKTKVNGKKILKV